MNKLFLLWILLLPFAAAHAVPTQSSPMPGSTLEQPPTEVSIWFSERVDLGGSHIEVYDSKGSRVGNQVHVDYLDTHHLVGKGVSQNGTYTVSWAVLSADDGHFTKGAYSFRVGEGAEGKEAEQILQEEGGLDIFWVGLELIGQALLVGALVMVLGGWASSEKVSKYLLSGAGLVILSTLAFSLKKTVDFGGLAIQHSFLGTELGHFTSYRFLLGLVCLGVWFWKGKKKSGQWICLGSVLLMILARARMSHAAASDVYPLFSVFINFVHLLAKETWAGIMIFLGWASIKKEQNEKRWLEAAVITAIVTGAYIVWLHLKSWSNLGTDWGIRCLILSMIAASWFALRLLNARSASKKRIRWEAAVGVIVLLLSGWMIVTSPPLKAPFEKSNNGVFLTEVRPRLLELTFKENVYHAVVTLENKEKSIGPIVAGVEAKENGFVFPMSSLSVPGSWKMEVIGHQAGAYDVLASFQVLFPEDFKKERGFGFFELSLILGAILLVGILWWNKINKGY